IFPDVALWHPRAGRYFSTYEEYRDWYGRFRGAAGGRRPVVGAIVFRQYVTGGATRHYEAVIAALEAEGIDVVAGFGGLDNRRLVDGLLRPAGVELLLNLTGFNLIGSMGRPQPEQ